MRYRYISDSHAHSDCSIDGVDPATMLCERAAALGLYALTVTDHCECDAYLKDGYDKAIRQSFFEARKARAVFRDRLRVYAGMELGQPLHDLDAAEKALSSCSFDFVLGSVHNLRDKEDFYFLDYGSVNVEVLLQCYFDELLEMVEWGGFDSLAHLTYPLRYIVGDHGIPVDLNRFRPSIDAILKALVERDLALEINTSGLRQAIGLTMPELDIVARFKELGGRYVTIGSDAHRWADIGAGVEEGIALAAKAGFTHFAVYEQRRPRLLPIE